MTRTNHIVSVILMAFLTVLFLHQTGGTVFSQHQPVGSASIPVPETISSSFKENITKKWGIEIIGIRLTAADKMLDFRYKLIDPEKASPLLKRQTESFLINQSTGEKLIVPKTKLGSMRQTSVKPTPNRNYFILFANPNRSVKSGSKVTLILGDLKAENLTVE